MQTAQSTSTRWTIPKRARMNGENLHISVFNLVRKSSKEGKSILFLKAGPKFPISFKRGKWLLPAALLDFGEKPRDVAKRVLSQQLANLDYLVPSYLSMQSYLGAHWDIVLVFESQLDESRPMPTPKDPFTDIAFLKLDSLPKSEIAEDHLEVLDELRREQ